MHIVLDSYMYFKLIYLYLELDNGLVQVELYNKQVNFVSALLNQLKIKKFYVFKLNGQIMSTSRPNRFSLRHVQVGFPTLTIPEE